MAIRRKRINRAVKLTTNGHNRVVDIPPAWAFTIHCKQSGNEYRFDFERYRSTGRDSLAQQMRDAIWSMRNEKVGQTLKGLFYDILPFWNFLDELEQAGRPVTRLDQIDRDTVDRYLAWMARQIATTGNRKGKPWAATGRKARYDSIKTLLLNRQRCLPESVSRRLSFPKNPFPNSNKKSINRQSYSANEQKSILAACRDDLARFRNDPEALPPLQVLAVHAIVIAHLTGVNVTSLLEARRDALQPFLPDRELFVLQKRRGYSTQVQSFHYQPAQYERNHSIVPTQVGDYFRQLCAYTDPLSNDATNGRYAFLLTLSADAWRSERPGKVVRLDCGNLFRALTIFVRRHDLRDDQGRSLKLSVARLRPTFACNLYQRTRDIRKVQRALGHSDPNITSQRYLPAATQEAMRNHAFVGRAMVAWATSRDNAKAEVLAADGQIPLQQATNLLAGGYNTAIARCKNPFREDGRVCGKYMKCFDCPNMIVFADDLWRLFSFYYRLLSERAKIAAHHWMRTYGWILKVIDEEIAPQFSSAAIDAAKRKAQECPHPTWAIGLPVRD